MGQIEEIATLFSASDAAPIADGLRLVVPPPPAVDTKALEREASGHRVLILHGGAVIAVTTVVSIGSAILLHTLFAGVFVLGWLFPSHAIHVDSDANGIAPEGGSGYILADQTDASPAGTSADALRAAAGAASPPVNDLPPTSKLLPLREPTSAELTAQQLAEPLPESAIVPPDLGSVKVVRPQPTNSSLTVSPPPSSTSSVPTPAVASVLSRRGAIGADGESDEPIFNNFKNRGSGGGNSGQSGSGQGRGLDRGLSAADRSAQFLGFLGTTANTLALPLKYQVKPPTKPVRLRLTILADGKIGEAEVYESCGVTEVDQLVRDYVLANSRFSPAYRSGKAIASSFFFDVPFGPLDAP